MANFYRELLKFLLLYVVRPVLLLVVAVFSFFYKVLYGWWIDNRKPIAEGFPPGFRIQRIGVTPAVDASGLPGAEIAEYFREHPETAEALLGECSDKRYTPATIIWKNEGGSFSVGWFTRNAQYEYVRDFDNLADAATDYLLFSLGKSRWTPANVRHRIII